MIELTKSDVEAISGGYYYTALGAAIGFVFMSGWVASAVRHDVNKSDWSLVVSMMLGLGVFGAAIGGVVGFTLDDI